MKKITLQLLLLFGFTQLSFGQILSFEFSALTGDEITAQSNTNDANLTSSTISRGAGLTASANGSRFNAKNWALNSIADAVTGNDYMEFTITPSSGSQFSVSSIYIQMQRSETGPTGIALRSSLDGYASNLDQEYAISDITNTQTFTFTFSQTNSSSAVTYRVYMFAEAITGSCGVGDGSGNDIIVSGTTIKGEPSLNPTNFNATASSYNKIDLSWTDVVGGVEPDGYLIIANKTGNFDNPVDGIVQSDLADANGGINNISQATGLYSWSGLDIEAKYYFKIWAYTNSASDINYKVDGIVSTANATTSALPNAWINEIHYDNDGADVGEFVEVVIENPTSYNLTDFLVDLYNGSGGASYDNENLSAFTESTDFSEGGTVFRVYSLTYTSGIQNGPDGVALSYLGNLIQFLSYEGNIVATEGAANGFTSTEMGVSQVGDVTNPVGSSIGLTGTGTQYSDFTWTTFITASPGGKNTTQALPVELTSFIAKQIKAGVVLNWSTATEVNNYGFSVERKSEVGNREWEEIAFVEGHGNSNSPKNYTFIDTSTPLSASYRLKQIDIDGRFEYSNIVTISESLVKTELFQNSPNPFNPSTLISFSLVEASKVNLSIYNILGQKIVQLINQNMESGIHNVEFNASNLSSGFFIYRLETSNYSRTMKMILLR